MSDSIVNRVGVRSVYELTTGRTIEGPSHLERMRVHCPSCKHEDKHPSCDLYIRDDRFKCHTCGAGGGILDMVIVAGHARDRAEAASWLEEKLDGPRVSANGRSRLVASFVYEENGKPLARVDRVEPGRNGRAKEFFPYVALPEGDFATKAGLNGTTLPLYRVDEVRAAIESSEAIYLVEGEGKCDALRAALRDAESTAAVTTLQGGASAPMRPGHVASFAGARRVIVLADSDDAGRRAMRSRAQRIANAYATCDVRAIDFYADRTDGSDVLDWLAETHTLDELLALADAAPCVALRREVPDGGCDDHNETNGLVTICATDVHAQRVTWFARDRIPFGAMTLLDGPGGIGKTTTLMGIIAAATVGHSFFDGGELGEALSALIVVEEDSLSVLKLRLQAAGADLNRVYFITGVRLGNAIESFGLPRHVPELEQTLEEIGARLVYVDSLFSHLELDGEGRMPQQVRRALRPVVEMLGRAGVAFAAVRHWTKESGPAAMRALGSVELGNVARSVLSFGRHPDDDARCVIAATKHNLSRPAPTIAYRIEAAPACDDDGQPCETTRADPDEGGVAEDWLQEYLGDGEPRPSAEVYAAARKDGVGSRATLKRAANRLGVVMSREGFATKGGAQSTWTLPLGSRSAHSQGVSRAGESAMGDTSKTLDSQRSAQGLALGANSDAEPGGEPSDSGVIRGW